MPAFVYKAIGNDGRIERGRAEAASLDELACRLGERGFDLLAARPPLAGRWTRQRLSQRERIVFCFHLEQLVQSGIPIVDGLAELRDTGTSGPLRQVVTRIVAAIEGGKPLSMALAEHPACFDGIFVNAIRAGEASGRLPEVLRSLVESLQWADECRARTRKLLAYPAIAAGIVLAATIFLMLHLVPQLQAFIVAMGQPLPPGTRLLFRLSGALSAHWPALLGLTAATVAGLTLLARFHPDAPRHLDAMRLRLPLAGPILHKQAIARLTHTLALLYGAGIPVLDALNDARTVVGNRLIEAGLAQAGLRVAEGQCLSRAFGDSRLFPPLVVRMLHTGESSGRLEEALLKICYFYNRDVRESVERAQTLIEPALTALLGLLLGWVMLAVLGPIHDIVGGALP